MDIHMVVLVSFIVLTALIAIWGVFFCEQTEAERKQQIADILSQIYDKKDGGQ